MTITAVENRPRGGKGRFTRQVESAERDGEACRLRAQGWGYREISEHLGYGSPGNAHRGVQRALAETASLHGARELRELLVVELSELRRRMWDLIRSPPPAFDRLGRIVTREDGTEVPDVVAVTNAGSVLIRAVDRLARLTGADAPRRSVSILADVSIADLQAHLEMLRDELGLQPDEAPPRGAIAGTIVDSGHSE
ncbi:MAG TPA: hypothetical protein VNF47_10870 [Streptosporangiaceae bacterium]|nr:hypothetical protein [Streptosporangiaceae bacterium]